MNLQGHRALLNLLSVKMFYKCMVFLIITPALASAQSDSYVGPPFWVAIDLSGATDLGHSAQPISQGDIVLPGEISFSDVTNAAGLGNAHGGGNDHGVGIAFVDLNNDEYADIFVANGISNRNAGQFQSQYYRNNQDGTFQDITVSSGVRSILQDRDAYSVAAGDYDSDGDIDLYIGAHPRDVLLRNRGDGTFEDATVAAGAGGPQSSSQISADGRSKIVAFGDYDGDGYLDIVSASSAFISHSQHAYLLRNLGNGQFEDVTTATSMRAHPSGNPCAVMWSDIENDGDQDLWIWNDRGGHILLRNNNGNNFTDITSQTNVAISHPMGIDAADIDHDGDLDYYISNAGRNNVLLRNNGDTSFNNIASSSGTSGDFAWGQAFEDFNLDSWYDIFVTQEDNRVYQAFRNNGVSPPLFTQLSFPHPNVLIPSAAHNVAAGFADYDHDGRVDVIIATTDGTRLLLFRNVTAVGSHRWLQVAVDSVPGTNERGGVSARVAVKTGNLIQFKDITGGSSRASQNELNVRFGLGNWTGVEWVAVLWPDGRQIAVRNVTANQVLRLPLQSGNTPPAAPRNLRFIAPP